MKQNSMPVDQQKKTQNSIAKRLIFSLSLGIFIVLLMVSFLQIYILVSDARTSQESNLQHYARKAAPTLSESLWEVNLNQAYLNIESLLQEDDIVGVVIKDENNNEFSRLGNYLDSKNNIVCKKSTDIKIFHSVNINEECINNKQFLVAATMPIMHGNILIGSVTIYGNKDKIFQGIMRPIIATILSAIFILVGIYLVATVIIKRLIGTPLHELSKLIVQLDSTNVSETWKISTAFTERDDELGELSKVFDDMVLKISEYQNHLEEIVQERTEKLRIAVASKSDFLSHMSHEIRTPINGILGLTETLLLEKTDPIVHKRLQMIDRSGKYLLRIVNDILDISKMEAGKLSLECLPTKLTDLVNEVANIFINDSKRDKIALNIDIASDVPKCVYVDSFRLKQILINLVANAFKFTEQGSITCSIASLPNNTIKFSVCDTGIGIAPDKIEQLFEAFSQADKSTTRVYGGTGLGLTISKELVEMMGGIIGASKNPSSSPQNNAGSGSCFYFTLPLLIAEETVKDIITTSSEIQARIKSNIKILAADDQQINQVVVTAMLEKLGSRIDVVENGEAVLDLCIHQPHQYDLILMDCEMPKLDGWMTTQRLRELKITRANGEAILIIGLSAHAIEGATQRALESGMNEYLTKPVLMADLIDKLQKYDLLV